MPKSLPFEIDALCLENLYMKVQRLYLSHFFYFESDLVETRIEKLREICQKLLKEIPIGATIVADLHEVKTIDKSGFKFLCELHDRVIKSGSLFKITGNHPTGNALFDFECTAECYCNHPKPHFVQKFS